MKVASTLPHKRFQYLISSFDRYTFPKRSFDLINASYALPFNSPETFDQMFLRLSMSLKPNGIFVGQLFGDRDEWREKRKGMTFHSIDAAKQLFSNFKIISFEEDEAQRPMATGGEKHWHVFHIIGQIN